MLNQTRLPRNAMRAFMLSMASLLLVSCADDNTPEPFAGIVNAPVATNWNLVWSDEFNGPNLNAEWSHGLNADWAHDIGTGPMSNGWGNGELQYYQVDNTTVADGVLTIEAREEAVGGAAYTSSRITTEGKQSFQFGKIEVRAKMPDGQGLLPAVWMLGDSFSSVGWPFSGEIDILEIAGGLEPKDDEGDEDVPRSKTVLGTIHWEDSGHKFKGENFYLRNGTFADDFHVFSIEWDSTMIQWFVDGQLYHTENISSAAQSELRESFFLLINLAVGHQTLSGNPDATTFQSPQKLIVDYIRVFEKV